MDFPIYPKNMTREERVNFLQHHLDVAVNHIRNLEGDLGTAREALRQAATIEVNSGEENARLITLVAQLKARVGELGAENDRLQRFAPRAGARPTRTAMPLAIEMATATPWKNSRASNDQE